MLQTPFGFPVDILPEPGGSQQNKYCQVLTVKQVIFLHRLAVCTETKYRQTSHFSAVIT